MATLFQRNGIWYINYSVDGKQRRKSTRTGDQRLAEIALKDLELKLFKGDLAGHKPKRRAKLEDVFHRYLLYVEDSCVPGHANHVRYQLNLWRTFLDEAGVINLEDIDHKMVDDFFFSCLRNRSPKTKKEYLTALKACLNRAVKWDLLEKNPIGSVQPPGKIVRKIRFFSAKEVEHLIRNAPYDLQVAIKILVNTGMRLGELWALRWKDIDLANKQLWVRSYDGFTPKGKRDRTIPLNDTCLDTIRELKSSADRHNTYVYRLTKSYKRLSNKFIRYCKKLGVKGSLHDLRHTFASHLVMSGSPLPAVQELLGHADITTTMVYAHLAPNVHRREVAKLPFPAQKQHSSCNMLQCKALDRFKSSHPDLFFVWSISC